MDGNSALTAGSTIRARGRDWLVLPNSCDSLLLLEPLRGHPLESTGVLVDELDLETADTSFARVPPDDQEDGAAPRLSLDESPRRKRNDASVERAAEQFVQLVGRGLTLDTRNSALRESLQCERIGLDDFHSFLIRTLYRLLFLLLAEDRRIEGVSLLHSVDGQTSESGRRRYADYYSANRLRNLALSIEGDEHVDLWRQFQLVSRTLTGAERYSSIRSALALPAMDSFLWRREIEPMLADAVLSNRCFLRAIRFLSAGPSNEGVPLSEESVDARRLGSSYERLLGLRPSWDPRTGFSLVQHMGKKRKASGSYYTPDALVGFLLDAALEPAIAAAVRDNSGEDAERSLLRLKICDPAVGSGQFLFGAADRLAKKLIEIRTQPLARDRGADIHSPAVENRPSLMNDLFRARRDVIDACLFGVDIDPMAVELCRIRLWLEAPGISFQSLSNQIKVGDSLLTSISEFAELFGETGPAGDGIDETPHPTLSLKGRGSREPLTLPSPSGGEGIREPLTLTLSLKGRGEQRTPHPNPLPQGERGPESSLPQAEKTRKITLDAARGFDVILGNPPFVNAIEGGVDDQAKKRMKSLFPRLKGTADLSYYFLEKSVQLIREGGRIGLVLPRSILNATSADGLRQSLSGPLRPNMLCTPDRKDFFAGAAVYVVGIALGPDRQCRVSASLDANGNDGRVGTLESSNWWLEARRILQKGANDRVTGSARSTRSSAQGERPREAAESTSAPRGSRSLGSVAASGNVGVPLRDRFDISASMTAADAYDLLAHLVDRAHGDHLKLITTGLIEPGASLWGEVKCRYLKQDYRFPRIVFSDELTSSLRRRLLNARRPKVIVAGLSKVVECYLDDRGQCAGAVSTYTIFDRKDDIESLRRLARFLLSKEVTERFHAELGGNAMGGGNITLKKAFLEQLPFVAQ